MPRFTESPFRSPPDLPELRLTISVDGDPAGEVTEADLTALGLSEYRFDFLCVTTGAADHQRGYLLTKDALAPDVLLAVRLNGERLGGRHGGPLRLVAPRHYAYKSIKHLTSVDFSREPPRRLGKEHLRGRVAHQERHCSLPTWFVRLPYRLLIPPTPYPAERSLKRSQPGQTGV